MKTGQKADNEADVEKRGGLISHFQLMVLLLLATVAASCGNKSKTVHTTGDANADVQSEQKAPKEKKLPFERGSYVEESNAMGLEMKKTVYFDQWGDWTATENKSEMVITKDYTQKINKLEIVKGSTHWDIDLIEKKGKTYEASIPMGGMAAALGAALGGKMMEGMEIKELGDENYMGYQCKKVQVKYPQMDMDATVLSYGNLTMKMDGKMGKMDISTKITSIDLSAPPASIFEVPEDVEITKN